MSKGMNEGAKSIIGWVIAAGVIALIILILSILFGNLSGNVGFPSGSQGYNDTQQIILNYTTSGTNVTAQLPTVGTIIGVALLLLVLLWILALAINKMMGIGGDATNAKFGA